MEQVRKSILPVLLATLWISISEFFRNQFLLNSYWVELYKSMGQNFPAEPVNGAMWGVWSLLFAIVIYLLSKKFTLVQTTILSWIIGFLMMWIVIGNLGVLPFGMLGYALPLSILEAFLASLIVQRIPLRK